MSDLIERAIQSAEARIYKLQSGKNHTARHQEKAENQIELQNVTIEALKFYEKYKQLEEQGLLLRLPCNVGYTVWFIRKSYGIPELIETKIEKIGIMQRGMYIKLYCNAMYETSCNSIGKTVFLTREEAEQALEKMKGE